MSGKNRVEQRDHLLTSLGLLVDPIRRLIFEEDDPAKLIPYIRSQFMQDLQVFQNELEALCRTDKHWFNNEYSTAAGAARDFSNLIDPLRYPELREEVKLKFPIFLRTAQAAIRSIPCDDPDLILPADSPFQTYVHLRAICSGANNRVQLFDPYLDAEPFHRYLADLDQGIEITVVTHEKIMLVQPNDKKSMQRRDRIISVSELLAAERPDSYRFLVTSQQHDRHLRVDQTILHFGGSVKDASKKAPYTIGTLDPTQSNHAFLDSVIANAMEWFGPSVSTHRRI